MVFGLAGFRGISSLDPGRLMHDLFHDFDPARTITLLAKEDEEIGRSKLKVKLQPRDNTIVTSVPAPNAPFSPPPGSQEPNISAVSDTEIVFDYKDHAISHGWGVDVKTLTLVLFVTPDQLSACGLQRIQIAIIGNNVDDARRGRQG